jgi:hypothetical protein
VLLHELASIQNTIEREVLYIDGFYLMFPILDMFPILVFSKTTILTSSREISPKRYVLQKMDVSCKGQNRKEKSEKQPVLDKSFWLLPITNTIYWKAHCKVVKNIK